MFLIFLCFLGICIVSCNRNAQVEIPEEYALLRDRSNFKDSLYESTFSKAYQRFLSERKYGITAQILMAKGDALDYYLQYDSIYLKQCVDFITKYDQSLSDNQNMEIHYFIGSQYDFNRNIKESKRWLTDAIAYSPNPKKETIEGFSHLILSDQQKIQGQLDSSQYHAFEALKVFEATKDTTNISSIQYSLFRISSSMNDDKNAKKALNRMIYYGKAAKDTSNICLAYAGHALHFIKTDTTYQSLIAYKDSLGNLLKHWKKPVQHYLFMDSYFKTAIHIKNNEIEAAEKELAKADSLANPNGYHHNYYLKDARLNLSYAKTGNYNQELFEEMVNAAEKAKDYYRGINLLRDMIASKEKVKEYEQAFLYLKKHNRLRDFLWNKDLKAKIYEFEKKFQTSKKEQKIAEQEKSIIQQNSIIGLLLLSIIIIGLGFVIYNTRKKRRALEKEQQLQESFTQQLLENTENERSRIAGDLHDSVNHKLLQISTKAKDGKPIEHSELAKIIEQVRNISHNLHPVMFERIGLEKSIEELCRNIMETTNLLISTQISYTKTLSTQQELQIYRIVEEALNNIIKHSKANNALIKIISSQSELDISIRDNGKGFDVESLKGDKITFGLANIKQRAKSIKGNLNFVSNPKGTQLNLTVKT